MSAYLHQELLFALLDLPFQHQELLELLPQSVFIRELPRLIEGFVPNRKFLSLVLVVQRPLLYQLPFRFPEFFYVLVQPVKPAANYLLILRINLRLGVDLLQIQSGHGLPSLCRTFGLVASISSVPQESLGMFVEHVPGG